MIAGEKMKYKGKQVALFPMDYINITQVSGPSSLSHCCGHPCDYVGTTSNYPIYAPFDCHLVYSDNVGNTRAYSSNDKVWTPQGLTYVTVSFTHDNYPPTQTTFLQGDVIARTGTAGMVTGDHAHIDQSNIDNAQLVSYGITCAYGNLCYALQNSQEVNDIFFITGKEIIVNTQGIEFEVFKKRFPWWMAKKVIERRKYGI